MKNFLLILTLLFASFSFAADGPFSVFYGIKTQNPGQIVAATDELWKSCDKGNIEISLNQDAINGENETTHTFVVNFPNNAAFAKWNKLFDTCPGVATPGHVSKSLFHFANAALFGKLTTKVCVVSFSPFMAS